MPEIQNPSPGPGRFSQFKTVTNLTSAQIKALSTTPVTLVPAPGAGKVITVFGCAFAYHFGSIAYTPSNGSIDVDYGGNAGNDIVDVTTLGSIVGGANSIFSYASGGPAAVSNLLPGADNQAVLLKGSAFNNGPIVTTTLGAGGTGYVANDTGTLTDGNGDATYKVLTVGAGGAVLTYQITAPGTGYIVENLSPTATGGAQPGVGINFTVNITAVQTGDGTLKVVTYYDIIPVP